MTILQLISSGQGYYGAEQVVITLSGELRSLGFKPVVAAFSNHFKGVDTEVLDRAAARGLSTEEVRCGGRLDWKAVNRLCELLAKYSVEVIHSHGPKTNLYAALAARKTSTRLLATCHTWHINSARDWFLSVVDRCTLHAFDAIVVVSETMCSQVRRAAIRPSRTHVIVNGIDLGPFQPTQGLKRHQLPIGGDLVIGTVARLSPEKGHRYLLRAIASIPKDFPNCRLVIAGEGPERPALEEQARQLGLASRVLFLGTRTEVASLYASFDIFVLPSLSEGTPLALIEAMASGCPVIASHVGGVGSIVHHNKTGILVPPKDTDALSQQIQRLSRNAQLRKELSLAAQCDVASRYAARTMASQYASLYESLHGSVKSMASAAILAKNRSSTIPR